MATQLNSIQFLQKLKDSVKEFKKKSLETRDDNDTAHFFDNNLKIFLKNHKDELKILSEMNFDKSFMSWIKMYLFKEETNDRA